MIVRIAIEGKIRDKNVEAIISEYKKRLLPYFNFEILEFGVGNSKIFEKLLKSSKSDDIFIGFDEKGKKFNSVSFANWFNDIRIEAKSITFIIGESEGLSDLARTYSKELISLSDLTLSYRISLIVAVEQIYRAMTIINRHPYHK